MKKRERERRKRNIAQRKSNITRERETNKQTDTDPRTDRRATRSPETFRLPLQWADTGTYSRLPLVGVAIKETSPEGGRKWREYNQRKRDGKGE